VSRISTHVHVDDTVDKNIEICDPSAMYGVEVMAFYKTRLQCNK
jgi:hypothetical protein